VSDGGFFFAILSKMCESAPGVGVGRIKKNGHGTKMDVSDGSFFFQFCPKCVNPRLARRKVSRKKNTTCSEMDVHMGPKLKSRLSTSLESVWLHFSRHFPDFCGGGGPAWRR
jgi:hypothetical protein